MEEKENIVSSEVLRNVMDQLHDEIMIYDNNYRLVYVNQASLLHYGIPAEKLIGKQFDELDQVYWGNSTLPLVYKTKQMVTKRQITNLGQDILTISVPIFDEEALKILEYYAWPGNVRELSHVMEKLVVLSKEEAIHISDLPKDLFQITSEQRTLDIHRGLNDVLEEVEREMVLAAYKEYQTSVKVAKVLDISQPKAYRLIQKYIDV